MKFDVLALSRTPGEFIRINSDQENSVITLSAYLKQRIESVSFVGVLSHSDKGEFHLKGMISALLTGDCDRCLKPASRKLDVEISEIFRRTSGSCNGADLDNYYGYAGHEIDIDQAIRDNLLLNLPLQLLCRDDCAGLCPVCGGNLNENECSCSKLSQEISLPFSELEKLLQDD